MTERIYSTRAYERSMRAAVLDSDVGEGGYSSIEPSSIWVAAVNADAAYGDGRVNAVVNLLEALRNQLDAQRAKHVSEAAYLTLDSAAEQLIAIL